MVLPIQHLVVIIIFYIIHNIGKLVDKGEKAGKKGEIKEN